MNIRQWLSTALNEYVEYYDFCRIGRAYKSILKIIRAKSKKGSHYNCYVRQVISLKRGNKMKNDLIGTGVYLVLAIKRGNKMKNDLIGTGVYLVLAITSIIMSDYLPIMLHDALLVIGGVFLGGFCAMSSWVKVKAKAAENLKD